MTTPCPSCGAVFSDDETCQERFHLTQTLEFERPAYFAAHHLSVPCYMLQHNAYAREGWLAARALLGKFASGQMNPERMVRQNQRKMNHRDHKGSLTRGPKLPGVEAVVWTFTVAEVRLETADHYCADVRRWAERVLADSEELVALVSHSNA